MSRRDFKLVLTCCFVGLLAMPAKSVWADASVSIEKNGLVYSNPTYPYQGHKYNYDNAPGDNDMPWLRAFAATHGIMDNVNMTLDWKDREFDMMKAIAHYTTYTMSWTGTSTVTVSDRAKQILELHIQHPEYGWGCGKVSAAAVGLAQAFGIPARFINAVNSTPPNGFDYSCEFFSTRYNRWIYFCPKTYSWIEDANIGPLGSREIHAHDQQNPIIADNNSGTWVARSNPPLVFMPNTGNRAPISPWFSFKWWYGYWHAFRVTYKTQPNGVYPLCCENPRLLSASNSITYNQLRGQSFPVVFMDSLDINYPLNNIEAAAQLADDEVQLTMQNNMVEFVRYETAIMSGSALNQTPAQSDWSPISLNQTGPSTYVWSPDQSARLWIRGVNVASVHSPDVVVFYEADAEVPVDSDGDGVPDDEDVCPNGPVGIPVHADGRPRSDLNGDCQVDALDIQILIEDLLSQKSPSK